MESRQGDFRCLSSSTRLLCTKTMIFNPNIHYLSFSLLSVEASTPMSPVKVIHSEATTPTDNTAFLTNEVKDIGRAMIALADTVNVALVKFNELDTRLDELQTVQKVVNIKLDRVDAYLSRVDANTQPRAVSAAVLSPAAVSSGAAGVAIGADNKNKSKKAKTLAGILQKDILNIDFDVCEQKRMGSGPTNQAMASTGKDTRLTPSLNPKFTKGFRSANRVHGIVGAFVRHEQESTRKKLFTSQVVHSTPTGSKDSPLSSSSNTSSSRIPFLSPNTRIHPTPPPILPKVLYSLHF